MTREQCLDRLDAIQRALEFFKNKENYEIGEVISSVEMRGIETAKEALDEVLKLRLYLVSIAFPEGKL
ncbi:MAG: hypothetical protein EBZ49_00025 [Proteobacteria bacterium]|nr:hypothetical protein [Pseudomonadota bacterium]